MSDPVLSLEDICVRYGRGARRFDVLSGVDLTVQAGEVVGLRGPSGCGKSTLLRVITTTERPTSGTVRLGGTPVDGPRRDGFVMPIGQNASAALDPRWPLWRSITEPLTAPYRGLHLSRDDRRRIARERLHEVGLDGVDVEALPSRLSGGQRQRVVILRALTAAPRLIVADEPTSALDVSVAAGVLNLLAQTAASGTAIVVASHDRAALDVLCDRVFEVQGGRLAAVGGADHTDSSVGQLAPAGPSV
ncbi:ABC transporter ATP-binding protein (plasmid) [Nocardioides sp. R1-1]|uniref:ABC transporter ATP-binding protein n=1 Tax=Nocardioides sp. R1-1 TaxID=3383502 RepID=UPI0038D1C2B3